jgi:hypothetical protein
VINDSARSPARAELRTAALEEGAFRGVVTARDRRIVRTSGFVGAPESAKQIGANGVEQVVAIKAQRIDERQRGAGTLDFGDRDGAVKCDDGSRSHHDELVVERENLAPVGLCCCGRVAVHGVDRGLNLIRPRRIAREAASDERLTLSDERAIPAVTILIGEQHEVAVGRHAPRAPRVDEQHQCKQTHHFRFVGHQLVQLPSETDGLRAQILTLQPLA